jgi:hypothetical protein
MALSIEINGVDRTEWLAVNSLRVSRPLGGRASGNAVLEDRGRGYTPTLDHEFVLKDGATKYFAGTIRSIDEFCHPPTFRKQFSLRLLDFNHICDRRRTRSITYSGSPGVSLRDIVLSIVATFLDGEGINVTNVATGPTIDEPVTFNYHSVTEAFDYLSRLTSKYGDPYLWYIDFDKNLYFSQFTANTAPFSLTDTSANFWDFKLSRSLDNYRNIQHARTEYEVAPILTESFTGNGSTIWFVTTQLVTDTPLVVVNGVQQTVGEFGVDHLSNTWYWIRNSPGVHITNQVPLTGSDTLVVTYRPLATNVVTVSDESEIATYGKFEAIDEQKNVDDYQTLVAIATGGLSQFGTVPVKPTFKTRTAGLEPGQRLTINLTRHGINASYLIEDVYFRVVAAAQSFLEFDVRCTSTERAGAARTAWMESVVRMARIGRPPQTITGTGGGGSVPGGVGAWSERPSGSMNGVNTTFTLASAPSPTAGLILALNGLIMRPGVDFTISGQTITLVNAPSSSDWLRAWYDFAYLYNSETPTNTSPLGGIYTLAAAPFSGTLIFAVNGLVALNGTDYTLSSATVDFTDAPDSDDWAVAWYSSGPTAGYSYNETPMGTVDGSNKAFVLGVTPSGCMVAVNGVLQAEGLTYTRSGTTITFLTAPESGDWIRVWSKS